MSIRPVTGRGFSLPLVLLVGAATSIATPPRAVAQNPQKPDGGADDSETPLDDDPDSLNRCGHGAEGPYLVVAGGDPATDRLPLKETSGDIQIAGPIAHVRVHQRFENIAAHPIEAIYVFPASTRAAVHGMRMTIGTRVVEARIDRKTTAAAAYDEAKREGKRASLLEQQRANVFSMKVAHVMPGDRITVDMDYSEMLIPEGGVYELVYPGVVGPRYPGGTDAKVEADAFIAQPYLPEGQPEPYTFDVRTRVDSALPIAELASPSHDVAVTYRAPTSADVRLKKAGGGNRDFVLRYRLSGDRIETGVLLAPPATPRGEGFFAVMMEPPRRSTPEDAPPREFIFLVDVSGSMFGFPLDTAKALGHKLLEDLRPGDAFNVVLFAGASRVMAPRGSVAATPANIRAALAMLGDQQGGGGTELMGGLQAAYGIPVAAARTRTVVVITDGFVGVEAATFRFIREHLGKANLFAFGIGSSVNRALIEGMARAGVGEPFVVLDPGQAAASAERFRRYIERPLLTNVTTSFDGFDAYDLAPARLPDLMSERPLVLFGKYHGRPSGRVVVTGRDAQGTFRRAINIEPPRGTTRASALRWLWARKQAEVFEDDLTLRQSDQTAAALADLGLKYTLLTSQTSFVAVDRVLANTQGDLTAAKQPLSLPAGVGNRAVGAVASVVSISRTEMPPGDPVLTVMASRDARMVTAVFPFGLVKDLRFDPVKERWQTRFLVPKDVKDGVYDVPVAVVHANGHTEFLKVIYRIDSSKPDFDLGVEATDHGVQLRVTGRESLRKVIVARADLPEARIELADTGDGLTFTGFLSLVPGRYQLRVVVSDRARNEADDLIGVEIP